jgi:hypothetical protein
MEYTQVTLFKANRSTDYIISLKYNNVDLVINESKITLINLDCSHDNILEQEYIIADKLQSTL